ncbi:MAG: helix-turn-helix domain-containing protein [Planctomycetota bacterium]
MEDTYLLLPDLLTVEDLAGHLRLSPCTVRRLLRGRVLPGTKIAGRWIVERHALLRALAPDGACSRQFGVLRGGFRASQKGPSEGPAATNPARQDGSLDP